MAQYLDLRALASRLGVTHETVSTYHTKAEAHRKAGTPQPGDLPEPDLRVAGHPAWKLEAIIRWERTRPGQGKGGGRPWERSKTSAAPGQADSQNQTPPSTIH